MNIEHSLWTEKWRPQKLADYVFSNPQQKAQIEKFITNQDIPHLLLHGSPGTGKSSAATMLINELHIDPYDVLWINASRERNIDIMRDRITTFAGTMPFGTFKIVVLDECLDENTLVTILRDGKEQQISIALLDFKNDLVKSFNVKKEQIEWKPFELFDKGIRETLEIEFTNGQKIICTPEHKWYVEDPKTKQPIVVKAKDLYKFEHILIP